MNDIKDACPYCGNEDYTTDDSDVFNMGSAMETIDSCYCPKCENVFTRRCFYALALVGKRIEKGVSED